MKIGTFVNDHHIPMTQTEVDEAKNLILSAFEKYGFKLKEFENVTEPYVSKEYPNAKCGYLDISANFTLISEKGEILGRNYQNGRIHFKSVTIKVSNQVDKDGAHQYELWTTCEGREIPYGCREVSPISVKNHFDYNTELSELGFEAIAKDLYNKTSLVRQTKRQLEKISAALYPQR